MPNNVSWCTDFYVQSAEDYFNVKNKQVNLVSIQEIVDAIDDEYDDSFTNIFKSVNKNDSN